VTKPAGERMVDACLLVASEALGSELTCSPREPVPPRRADGDVPRDQAKFLSAIAYLPLNAIEATEWMDELEGHVAKLEREAAATASRAPATEELRELHPGGRNRRIDVYSRS
jgi:hypothetical protein